MISSWVWVSIAIIGAVFNARQNIIGFYLWIVSNVGLTVHNFMIGQNSQAVLFVVYTGITSYGIWKWQKLKRKEDRKNA